ncbi:hypothetical protein F183_A27940 [Bryobacterales bacterium F-183]|nr:hypothetical protein F183_A27940 [Bryobacterales bacterium F-183]
MLEFVDKQGNSIRTTISAIPALKNNGADKTVLQFERSNAGSIPYISHLWVEGKSYGYELPAPSDSTMTTATRTTTTTSDNSLRMEGSSRWAEPPAQVAQQTTPAPARVEEQPRPEPTPAPTPQPEPPAQVTAPEQPVAPATTAPAEDRLPTTADDTVAISILAGIALLCVGSATKLQKKRS